MPSKKKGKKHDDNWEEEADVVVNAAKESRLEGLFVEAMARGKLSDNDYDRATDQLASGAKTEDELIAFYFPNSAEDDAADDDASKAERKKTRGWRADRDGRTANPVDVTDEAAGEEVALAAEAEAQMRQLHVEIFGEQAPYALDVTEDGLSEVERVYLSELQLDEWRRAASDAPRELPLPNMTGVCLFGAYGVSTHAGGLLRLWDSNKGRRLAAHQQKNELTACAAEDALVVVGDATGALHAYATEGDFVPTRLAPIKSAEGAVRSIALLPMEAASGHLVLASSNDGVLTASLLRTEPWPPPAQTLSRSLVPLPHLCAPPAGVPLHLAAGPSGSVFGASGAAAFMLDLGASAAAWSTKGGEWTGGDLGWHGTCDASMMAEMRLAEAFSGVALEPPSSSVASSTGGASVAGASLPSRPVSYSPYWRLLAAAVDGGIVAMWDVRLPGDRGPAAAVRVVGGASWIHLDEAQGKSGHLLLAPTAGGPVQLYDVRRVPCVREGAAARPVATLAPPPNAAAVCFAAQGSTLVMGGGAKCGAALRYCGERAELSGEAEEDEDEGKEKRKPGKEKKKRLAKKEQIGSRQSRMA